MCGFILTWKKIVWRCAESYQQEVGRTARVPDERSSSVVSAFLLCARTVAENVLISAVIGRRFQSLS